jgi:hypothetical protein
MSENNSNANTGISAEQLETLLARVIKAVKEPNAIEQRKLDAEQRTIDADQANRKKVAADVLQTRATKRRIQQMCSHEHPNGTSHCVYVKEQVGPGYMLCQKNQCIIRPGVASPNYKGDVIYSNDLFNKIFQKMQSTQGDIIG